MEELNELKFVRKLIKGNAVAFATLCTSLSRKLPEFIARAGGLDYSDAEEVASDVLVKIHGAIRTFQPRPTAKLTTWIFTIAKRAAIDRKRKLISQSNKKPEETEYDERHITSTGEISKNLKRPSQYESEMLGEEEQIETSQSNPYTRALDTLNEREKDILRMTRVMSYEEISVIEGEPIGRLRTRRFRAFNHLHEEVGKLLKEEKSDE